MRMREFIRQNRKAIDEYIDCRLGFVSADTSCFCPLSGTLHHHQPDKRNDKERRLWVTSEERLCRWAQDQGVPV